MAQLEQVYIHGSKICLLILPDMLKNAPMLKNMKNKNQGSGAGQGKTAILKAQVAMRRRERKRIWKYLPEAKIILSLEWNFALIFLVGYLGSRVEVGLHAYVYVLGVLFVCLFVFDIFLFRSGEMFN